MRVAVVTVGCPKNTADSDLLRERLSSAGIGLLDDPARADAIVINTCGFIASACEESLDTIMELAEYKREGTCSRIVVCGCLPARYGADLRADLAEADELFGLAHECADEIAGYLLRVEGESRRRGRAGESVTARESAPRATPPTPYAYVKISDGCDRACSFCTIPAIRGPYRSRPAARISAEVSNLISGGIAEIILVGQETTAWGNDLRPQDSNRSLADLLNHLATTHPDTWFRAMYLQADGVTDELIDTVAAHDNVCDYFDIPFQHASPSVLRSMRRAGDASSFVALIGKIRAQVPEAAFRTSLITGFPGESEADIDELAAFMRAARFDFAGVFAFSAEEGTEAAALPNRLDAETIRERQRMLSDLAAEIGAGQAASHIGATLDVLVEDCLSEQDILCEGRSQFQAPEVDGMCLLDWAVAPGRVVRATVAETDGYDMLCRCL